MRLLGRILSDKRQIEVLLGYKHKELRCKYDVSSIDLQFRVVGRIHKLMTDANINLAKLASIA